MKRHAPLAALLFSVLVISVVAQTRPATTRPTTVRPAASQPSTRPVPPAGHDDEAGDPANPGAKGFDLSGSELEAIALADGTMRAMGGRAAWDATRCISWSFFGSRTHVWDKLSGDVRIEGTDRESGAPYVVIMNIHTDKGRAWKDSEEITEESELSRMLSAGESAWINDSYWLVMPYKLKDTGVTIRYEGVGETLNGRAADIVSLRFSGVGRTPANKYHVYVSRASGLIEQWDFYSTADDPEPALRTPWSNWQRYGRIMLSSDRGELRGRAAKITDIRVRDVVPPGVFTSPDPVVWK